MEKQKSFIEKLPAKIRIEFARKIIINDNKIIFLKKRTCSAENCATEIFKGAPEFIYLFLDKQKNTHFLLISDFYAATGLYKANDGKLIGVNYNDTKNNQKLREEMKNQAFGQQYYESLKLIEKIEKDYANELLEYNEAINRANHLHKSALDYFNEIALNACKDSAPRM